MRKGVKFFLGFATLAFMAATGAVSQEVAYPIIPDSQFPIVPDSQGKVLLLISDDFPRVANMFFNSKMTEFGVKYEIRTELSLSSKSCQLFIDGHRMKLSIADKAYASTFRFSSVGAVVALLQHYVKKQNPPVWIRAPAP